MSISNSKSNKSCGSSRTGSYPTFAISEPSQSSIEYYMPRRLSEESAEHWKRLVLKATISNNWSFRWVEDKAAQELIEFANSGLKLPSRKSLAGKILNDTSKSIQEQILQVAQEEKIGLTATFDGWKNIVSQSLIGTVIMTSTGKSLIWGIQDMSGERSRTQNVVDLMEKWLENSRNDNLKIICIITDSAGEYTAAR